MCWAIESLMYIFSRLRPAASTPACVRRGISPLGARRGASVCAPRTGLRWAAAALAGPSPWSWRVRLTTLACAPLSGACAWETLAGGSSAGEALPRVYDEDAVARAWLSRPVRVAARACAILAEVLPLGARLGLDLHTGRLADAGVQAAAAAEVREALVRLGPAFIKLGQALSIRPDLLPAGVLSELQRLVDACPAFADELAFALVERELGKDFHDLFEFDVDVDRDGGGGEGCEGARGEAGTGGDAGMGYVKGQGVRLPGTASVVVRAPSPGPVAAASLGQVYRVRDRTTGQRLAVKVQRPDMDSAVSLDLLLLRFLAGAADALTTWTTAQRTSHTDLVRAFATATWAELDYEHEARNQERFRRNFGISARDDRRGDRGGAAVGVGTGWAAANREQCRAGAGVEGRQQMPWWPRRWRGTAAWWWWARRYDSPEGETEAGSTTPTAKPAAWARLHVPRVYSHLTSRRVLTTEWVDGDQLARAPPEVIRRLVPVGVACFLQQLLADGFFHCDPHPGNLLVTPDGRLAIIDFGLCAEVAMPDTRRLTSAIVHVAEADAVRLVDDAVALGFLPAQGVDKEVIATILRRVLRPTDTAGNSTGALSATVASVGLAVRTDVGLAAESRGGGGGRRCSGTAHGGGGESPTRYGAVAARRRRFAEVSAELNDMFFRHPFAVPNYFALITRGLVVLEGIALKGDPDFDILRAALPWVVRHAARVLTDAEPGARVDAAAAGRAVLAVRL